MKPRFIYFSLFTWNAVTAGRFVAPYLSERSNLNDSSIGTILAIQIALSALLGGFGGELADRWERQSPRHGRLNVIRIGIVLGTLLCIIEGWVINIYMRDEGNRAGGILFLWNLLLRSGYSIAVALTQPVLDGLALAHLKRDGNGTTEDYGRERMYGAVGWGMSSVLIGILCENFGYDVTLLSMVLGSSLLCYLVFYIYEGTSQVTFQSEETTPLRNEQTPAVEAEETLWKLLLMACSTTYKIAFFVLYFLLNIGMAVVENLLFLFYREALGSSQTMCGLAVASTVLFELPIFYASPWVLRTIGPEVSMILACAAFIARTIGYGLVPRMGWFVLCLDMLHGISFACSQIASVEFIAKAMPNTYEASGQGLLLVIRGAGATIGLFFGGMIEDAIGGRGLYACLCAVVTFGLLLFCLAWMRDYARTIASVS